MQKKGDDQQFIWMSSTFCITSTNKKSIKKADKWAPHVRAEDRDRWKALFLKPLAWDKLHSHELKSSMINSYCKFQLRG